MQNDRPLILIVDDETKIRRLVARNLEDFGYDVVPAADGFKALAYFEEKTSDLPPDLILMDGGQGQVTSAEKVLTAMQLPIPVLGMAKDDSHRTRALVNGRGQEYLLKENPLLFKYCGRIQEEVHRFAIEYHRSLHNKNSIGSVLDNISGIGPAKRNALLAHFKSVDNIKAATLEKLTEVPGITEKNARAIREYFSCP